MDLRRILPPSAIVSLLLPVACALQAAEDPSSLDKMARADRGSINERSENLRKLEELAAGGDTVALEFLTKFARDSSVAPALREDAYKELVKLGGTRLDDKQMLEILKGGFEDESYYVRATVCGLTSRFWNINMAMKVELIASFLRKECSKPEQQRGAYGVFRLHSSYGSDQSIKHCLWLLVGLGADAAAPLTAFLAQNAPKLEEPDEALSFSLVLQRLRAREVSTERLLALASKTRSSCLIEETIKELHARDAKETIPFIKSHLQSDFAVLEKGYTLYYPVRDAAKKALKHFDPDGNYDDIVIRVDDLEEIRKYQRRHAPKE